MASNFQCAVVTVSDSVAEGSRQDVSGLKAREKLQALGFEVVESKVVADVHADIRAILERYADELHVDLVVTTGGTGLGPRDVTPEATRSAIEKEVPGLAELMRSETSRHTRFAFLSRALVGVRKETLIVNLPGSPQGVEQCLDVLADLLPHALDLIHGKTRHS
ncbi:MAG: MogA/MoaB family molybdenum cofactor biosynthesis protein [Acidobacteriia bacterium]|nr:MogA/MoaB family molybdenum cofactor biosynthesis protein [Terriglobia bacterium]